jgi:hypothetical protein
MPPLYAFEVAEARLADLLAGLSRVADRGLGLPTGDLCKAGYADRNAYRRAAVRCRTDLMSLSH